MNQILILQWEKLRHRELVKVITAKAGFDQSRFEPRPCGALRYTIHQQSFPGFC